MQYEPHSNPDTPPAHEYVVAGRLKPDGTREYVYCMTSGQPTVDSFISDLSNAVRFRDAVDFSARKKGYPGLRGLTLWRVGILDQY